VKKGGGLAVHILVIEDDDNIRDLIRYALQSAGYDVTGLPSGASLWDTLADKPTHLLLLDIMLPGEDGLSILQKLRAQPKTRELPVLLLSAKSQEFDKVKGLDLGADDYITKPFSVLELLARVKALLRRCVPAPMEDVITVSSLTIDTKRRKVTVDGAAVTLTFKEFELLCYLAQNKGVVLSRDKLMETLWGFDFEGESRTVDMHIKTLRQKLLSAGEMIQTVRNVGYTLEE